MRWPDRNAPLNSGHQLGSEANLAALDANVIRAYCDLDFIGTVEQACNYEFPSLVQIDLATQSWRFDAVWRTPLQGRGTPFIFVGAGIAETTQPEVAREQSQPVTGDSSIMKPGVYSTK